MGATLDRLRELKAKKEKYYKDAIDRGDDPLYGMGGEYRRKNTTQARSKRRYGFKRYSVRQRHRVTHKVLKRRLQPPKKLETILSPTDINVAYESNNIPLIMELLYESYGDFDYVFSKYSEGFSDISFHKILSLTGSNRSGDKMEYLKLNYSDFIIEAITRFIERIDNFVKTGSSTFYTYTVNIIPYLFSSYYYSEYNKNSVMYELSEDIVGDNDVYLGLNPLFLHVITHNLKKAEKRNLIKLII
mgnify:CR=1 FL=1